MLSAIITTLKVVYLIANNLCILYFQQCRCYQEAQTVFISFILHSMWHRCLAVEIQNTVISIWLTDFSYKKTEKQRRRLLNDIGYLMEICEGLRGREHPPNIPNALVRSHFCHHNGTWHFIAGVLFILEKLVLPRVYLTDHNSGKLTDSLLCLLQHWGHWWMTMGGGT